MLCPCLIIKEEQLALLDKEIEERERRLTNLRSVQERERKLKRLLSEEVPNILPSPSPSLSHA